MNYFFVVRVWIFILFVMLYFVFGVELTLSFALFVLFVLLFFLPSWIFFFSVSLIALGASSLRLVMSPR